MELENLFDDGKGKGASGSPVRPKVPRQRTGADCPVVVKKWGNAHGAKGQLRQVEAKVNQQWEEPKP